MNNIISSINIAAAYLGAAAWIPEILRWVYVLFAKPIITITADKTVSIGYTTHGPIFNLRLSINVDRKDALIDFMGVEICHQDGSKHFFEWIGMSEYLSEIKNNKNENQVIHRDIVPIAIKISTLSLSERFFRFQDSNFLKERNIEFNKLLETDQYMKKQKTDYPDCFLTSKEFEDYLKFARTHFYWKAGIYTVKFYVRSPVPTKLRENKLKFTLTQDNVDMLKSNLDEVKLDFEYNLKKDREDFSGQQPNWAWANLILNKDS